MRMSLGKKLILLLLGASILPMALLGYLTYRMATNTIIRQEMKRVEALARHQAGTLQEGLSYVKALLNLWATDAGTRGLVRDLVRLPQGSPGYERAKRRLNLMLTEWDRDHKEIKTISLLHPREDRVLASSQPERTGEALPLTISVPVKDDDGEVIGRLSAKLNIPWLEWGMISGFGAGIEIFMVDASGRGMMAGASSEPLSSEGVRAVLARKDGVLIYRNHRGFSVIGAYRWLDEINAGLLVEVDKGVILGPIERLNRRMALVALMVALLAVAVSYLLARSIVRPIAEFAREAHKIALGGFKERLKVTRRDEIGLLQMGFNVTAERMEHLLGEMMALSGRALVGRLAAGIAHELNNPITGIMGLSELILEGLKEDLNKKQLEEDIRKIYSATDRCSTIIQRLSKFVSEMKEPKGPVDVNQAVRQSIDLIERDFERASIDLKLVLHPDLPAIFGNNSLIMEVLLDLLTNAIDAMPEGGRLTVATASKNGWVQIAVADTGMGIAREDLGRIFDPFFTTKQTGRGAGLGLAIAKRVVEEHGGRIEVESSPGEGTIFRLSFPPYRS